MVGALMIYIVITYDGFRTGRAESALVLHLEETMLARSVTATVRTNPNLPNLSSGMSFKAAPFYD